MASGMSVDGLISGLDTTSLITQLINAEAAPQTALKTKVSTEKTVVSAYQAINSKMAALRTAAEALTTAGGWSVAKATSSSTNVTATASASASPGTMVFTVDKLARNEIDQSTSTYTSLDQQIVQTYPPSFTVTTSKGTTTVQPTTGKLSDVLSAINNTAGLGVHAYAVNLGNGTYAVQLSGDTPDISAISVSWTETDPNTGVQTPMTLGLQNLQTAQKAQLSIGPNTMTGRMTVTANSNTFSDLMPGVTITATAADPNTDVTLSVANDPNAIADKVQAMVDAANAAAAQIDLATSYDSTNQTASPLTGDYLARQLGTQIPDAVVGTVSVTPTGSSTAVAQTMASVGIDIDKDGKLTFDRSAFLTAYNADPSMTQQIVSTGVAKNLDDIATKASDSVTGSLSLMITSRNDAISQMNDEIAEWDTRLADRATALRRQFSAMETALGKLRDQSNWLAGQIAGLPSWGLTGG